jgi:photosystem II stability/assembly factor-like uncharacterized protein
MKSKFTLCLFIIIASLSLSQTMAWADGKWQIIRNDDFLRNDGVEGDLTDISFVDENNGWAVGISLILHTSDSGATWEVQSTDTEEPPMLWCVYFHDAKYGVVAGATSGGGFGGGTALLTTEDGGKTWVQRKDIYSILFSIGLEFQSDLDSQNISEGLRQEFKKEEISLSDRATVSIEETGSKWLIADNRRMYSIRKGEDALNICVNVGSRLTGIQMINENISYAVGESNTVLKTTDGGKTWISVMTGQRARVGETRRNLDGLYFATPEIGWVVGSFGGIIHTADGGKNWETQPVDTANDLKAAHFVNDKEGWVVGNEGSILHTADSGKTWEQQKSDTEDSLHSVVFLDKNIGWACGDFGTVVHTTDGGKTWKREDTGTSTNLRSISALKTPDGSKQYCWVVGEWGLIIRYVPNE